MCVTMEVKFLFKISGLNFKFSEMISKEDLSSPLSNNFSLLLRINSSIFSFLKDSL
jgi:hypothetical protein